MTGIENITGKLLQDAQGEIDRILSQAEEQARSIKADYEARAKKETADILSRGEHNAQERGRNLISAAQIEAGKQMLAAKQEILDRSFDLAFEKLLNLPVAEYTELLASLAAEAAETGEEVLLFNANDLARFGEAVTTRANELLAAGGKNGGLTFSPETRGIQGGLLVSNGAVEVNCALETLVRLQRGEMTGVVSKVLFQ